MASPEILGELASGADGYGAGQGARDVFRWDFAPFVQLAVGAPQAWGDGAAEVLDRFRAVDAGPFGVPVRDDVAYFRLLGSGFDLGSASLIAPGALRPSRTGCDDEARLRDQPCTGGKRRIDLRADRLLRLRAGDDALPAILHEKHNKDRDEGDECRGGEDEADAGSHTRSVVAREGRGRIVGQWGV